MVIVTATRRRARLSARSGCARTFPRRCAATGWSTRARGRSSTSPGAASTRFAWGRRGSSASPSRRRDVPGTPRSRESVTTRSCGWWPCSARLDGRQPAFDSYPEAEACLSALLGRPSRRPCGGARRDPIDRRRPGRPDRAHARGDRRADDDPGVGEGERDPLPLLRAGGLPRAAGLRRRARSRKRIEELLGRERRGGYALRFDENVVGNISPLEGPLAEAIDSYVQESDPVRRIRAAGAVRLYGQSLVPKSVSGVRCVRFFPATCDDVVRNYAVDSCSGRTNCG